MNLVLNPQGLFLADFMAVLDDARDQENRHPSNLGEYRIASSMHTFFEWHVLRLIRENDWVYKAAKIFAQDYSMECFRYLKSGAQEVFSTQIKLRETNEKVRNLLTRLTSLGANSKVGEIHLVKASDFINLIEKSKLTDAELHRVEELHEEIVDYEDMQMWVTLRSIRDNYEITLPRVMFIVRRVIKVMMKARPKVSDENLTGISEYLDWYETNVDSTHALFPVLGSLRSFYKVVRNVASYHEGFSWDPASDSVVLEDDNTRLVVHVYEFQQRYRYLVYLCEFGLRGILSEFCGRERGEISNNLIRQYAKTFPEDFPEGIPGRVRFYVQD
jgi:hypothetical protein